MFLLRPAQWPLAGLALTRSSLSQLLLVLLGLHWFGAGIGDAATYNWTGAASSDWFNTNNWSPAGLPGIGDTVNVANGTVQFSTPLTFNGQFNWTGGTLAGHALTIAPGSAMNISGNNAKNLWNALTNAGTITWTNTGNLVVDYSSAHNRFGFVENMAGALFEIQNNQNFNNTFNNGAYLRNAGIVRKTAGTGVTTFNVPFFNTGAVETLTGTIALSGGALVEGAFNAAAGSLITFNAGAFTYQTAPTITGAGTVRLNGGSMTLLEDAIVNLQLLAGTISLGPNFQGGSITNLTMLGGTLTGDNIVSGAFNWAGTLPGSLRLQSGATVNWSAGTMLGALTIASNAVLNITGNSAKSIRNALTNAGTVTWSGNGGLQVDFSSADSYFGLIENLPGGTWDIQNNQSIFNNYNNGAYFRNAGTVQKSAGTGNSTVSIPFYNSGLVTALTGTVILNNDSVIHGSFHAETGATISFNSGEFSYEVAPNITGNGVVRLGGGSLLLAEAGIAGLQIGSGTVRLAPGFQGGTITNLTLLGGTLEGDNVVSGTFTWSGTLPGSLTVLGGGTANWTGGVAAGGLTVLSNGVLNISGTTTKFIRGAVTNAGTVVCSGTGNLQVDYSSHDSYFGWIENLAGGVWEFQNNQNLLIGFNTGAYFRNAGSVRKTAGSGTSTITIPFFNYGSVTAFTGTIVFNRGAIIEGQFEASAGATINFNTGAFTYALPPTITGAGSVRLTGGTLTLARNAIPNLQLANGTITLGPAFQGGTITNLTMLGGTLTGDHSVSGTFHWEGTLAGSLRVLAGGIANWSGGRIHGPLTVAPGGTLNLAGSSTKFLWNALTNAGTVAFGGTADLRVDYSTSATNYGAIYNLAGALWDIQNNQNILNNFPTGAFFHNAGTVLKSAGSGTSTFTIPFFNSGAVTALSGTLVFNRGALIEGAFDAGIGAAIHFNNGPFSYGTAPVVSGGGTVQFTGGTLTLTHNIIPNLRLAGGVLSLDSSFQGGAITNLTMLGGTLAGNHTVSGSFDWAGTLAGSLTVLGGATVNWNGGITRGPITIASGGMLNIGGNTTKFLLHALTNAGTVTWTGNGDLEVNYSTTLENYGLIENLPGGVWDIQNDRTLRNAYNFTAYFRNAGTVRKSAGTDTSTISIPFTNSGTAISLQRTLAFTGGFAAAGGTMVAGLGSPTAYGRFHLPGTALLDGALNVLWHGGYVGSISNTFTILTYGSRTGTFSPVSLPAGAEWQINYGPTALTVFVAGIQRLGITSPALGTTNAGAVLAPVSVQVFDAATGNPIATNGLPITITLGSGVGVLSGTLTRSTGPAGNVTFNDLSINLVGAKTLAVLAPGLTGATNSSFNIISAAPAQLGLVTPIGPAQHNHAVFTPAPVLQVRDQFGNTVSNSTAEITARLGSGAGLLGGSTVMNAGATNGSAAFTNLVYALANPSAAESIVVYFTSPGLAAVTNPPVLVNFLLGTITLTSGNSVAQIDATSQDGVFSWTVEGVEQLYQQWFWVRRGATGPQVSLDRLGAPVGLAVSQNTATVNYQTAGLNVELAFTLIGGTTGSFASDLQQNLSIQNTSNGPVTLHLFQYADFDLGGLNWGDSLAFSNANTTVQHGKNMAMTQSSSRPPDFWEGSHYAITLEQITGSTPATLSNQLIPDAPGDQTFGNQWTVTLPPDQSLVVHLNSSLRTAGTLPPTHPPVYLLISRAAGSIVLSWPAPGTDDYALEWAAGCDGNADWLSVTNPVVLSGEFKQVTLPAVDGTRFFRLRR